MKPVIGVLFGAQSFEHEISIVSAIALKKVLDCQIEYIFCDYAREFYHIPYDKITSKRFSSSEYKKDPKVYLAKGAFFEKGLLKEKPLHVDFVINLIHGQDGEDGKIASLLDFYDIRYIGPRLEASVISYNKLFTKLYAKEIGVKSIDYKVVKKSDARDLNLDYPCILKPTHLGSSIGISVVKSSNELDYALDMAFEFDNEVIIEPFFEDVKEYNLAGYKADSFYLSILEEPKKSEFLNFENKYLDFSRTQKVNQADVGASVEEKLKKAFETIYNPLFSGALIRCDFFVYGDDVYINEINPVPGSMANYLFEDFQSHIFRLAQYLPSTMMVPHTYRYINSIQSAKGK